MSLTAEFNIRFSGRQTGSNDLGNPVYRPLLDRALAFTSGTGANQADLVFADTRTLSASGTEDLDLAGALADAFGATLTMAEIVGVIVSADAANTNNVVVGDATQPVGLFGGTNPTVAVKPGGVFALFAPNASGQCTVGAGSTDDLKITNSAGSTSVTYTVIVLARSA